MKIPIVGNGDISSPEKAKAFADQSGVDGLMIGRGAIGRPWIFRDIRHYFNTGEFLLPPLVPEVVESVKEQLIQSISWKPEPRGAILEMRRHFARYFPGLEDFREYRIQLLQATELEQVLAILDAIALSYASVRVDYTNISLK